jgi:hypothetical protein
MNQNRLHIWRKDTRSETPVSAEGQQIAKDEVRKDLRVAGNNNRDWLSWLGEG